MSASINNSYYDKLYGQQGGTGQSGELSFFDQDQEGDTDVFGSIGDVFQGGINGAEEALRSSFGLMNYAAPWRDSDEDIVDWNYIDEPDTILGQMVGGFTQFAVGAAVTTAAVMGTLYGVSAFMALGGGAAAIGGAAGLARTLGSVSAFSTKALQWYRSARVFKGVGGRKAFEYMVQSPAIDFAAFSSDSGRFSELIEESETLSNSVTAWLASDDDSVLEGRMKNVLDGMIGNVAVDSVFAPFKAMAKAKSKMKATDGAAEVSASPKFQQDMLDEYQRGRDVNMDVEALDPETLDDLLLVDGIGGFTDEAKMAVNAVTAGYINVGDLNNLMRIKGEEAGYAAADELIEMSPRKMRYRGDKLYVNMVDFTAAEKQAEIFKRDPENKRFTFEEFGIRNAPNLADQKTGAVLAFTMFSNLDDQARMALDNARAKANNLPMPHKLDMGQPTKGQTKEILDTADENDLLDMQADLLENIEKLSLFQETHLAQDFLSRNKHDPATIIRMALYANQVLDLSDGLTATMKSNISELRRGVAENPAEARKMLAHALRTKMELEEKARQIFSSTGQSLKMADRRFRSNKAKTAIGEALRKKTNSYQTQQDFLDMYEGLASKVEREADTATQSKLKALEDHMSEALNLAHDPSEVMEYMTKWAENFKTGDAVEALVHARTQNIIAGFKTLAIAVWSPVAVEPYKVLRNMYGEVWRQSNPGAQISAQRLINVAQRELRTSTGAAYYTFQNAKGYLGALRRSIATGNMKEVDDYRAQLRETSRRFRASGRFQSDVAVTTKAQRDAFRKSGSLAESMFGMGLEVQSRLAGPARIIETVDYAVQGGAGRARLEANIMFRELEKGADPRTAMKAARDKARIMIDQGDEMRRAYTADAIWGRAARREDVLSGKTNIHQATNEEILRADAMATRDRRDMQDASIRGQGMVFNRNVDELGEDTLKTYQGNRTGLPEDMRISDDLDGSVEQQMAIEKRMQDPGLADVVGSAPIRWGANVAADIAKTIRSRPAMRLFAPFLQVPINSATVSLDAIVGGTLENMAQGMRMSGKSARMFPLSEKFVQSLNHPDPAVRMSNAVNGVIAGSVLASAGFALSEPGVLIPDEANPLPMLTGGGPTDKGAMKAMQESGWRPYSIRFNDRYYSYQRFEPFASWLGMLADTIQVAHYYDANNYSQQSEDAVDTAVVVGISVLQRSLTDKTFTRGLNDLFAILNGDTKVLRSFTKELSTSAIIPNAVRDVSNYIQGDGADIKSTRTLMEKAMGSIPGLNSKVKDKRRNIFGEPIKRAFLSGNPVVDAMVPVNVSIVNDDVVTQELARVPNNWKGAPMRYEGVELLDDELIDEGQTLYDKWQERTSTISVRGKTLRQAMRTLIQNDQYQSIEPGLDEEGNYSARAGMLESLIRKYRKAAMTSLRNEDSSLDNRFRQQKDINRERRRQRKIRPSMYQ